MPRFLLILFRKCIHSYARSYATLIKLIVFLVKVKLKEKNVLPPDLDKEALQTLTKELRLETETLYFEKDNEKKCEAMEKIVQLIVQDDDIYPEMIAALGSCVACLLKNQIEEKMFPSVLNDE